MNMNRASFVLRHFLASVIAADATGKSVEEITDLHVLADLARQALTAEELEEVEREARYLVTDEWK